MKKVQIEYLYSNKPTNVIKAGYYTNTKEVVLKRLLINVLKTNNSYNLIVGQNHFKTVNTYYQSILKLLPKNLIHKKSFSKAYIQLVNNAIIYIQNKEAKRPYFYNYTIQDDLNLQIPTNYNDIILKPDTRLRQTPNVYYKTKDILSKKQLFHIKNQLSYNNYQRYCNLDNKNITKQELSIKTLKPKTTKILLDLSNSYMLIIQEEKNKIYIHKEYKKDLYLKQIPIIINKYNYDYLQITYKTERHHRQLLNQINKHKVKKTKKREMDIDRRKAKYYLQNYIENYYQVQKLIVNQEAKHLIQSIRYKGLDKRITNTIGYYLYKYNKIRIPQY